MDESLKNKIQAIVDSHHNVLFMKGTRHFPQCGFSATAVEVLRRCGAEFETFNVLEDMEVRQGIKEFGSWPTIPQLYVGGKLLGGSDILVEMYESGELQPLVAPPS
ncbi:MAG: Grx4 family monothiol glutaredoxin [Sandaracinaceae bacterium]|nr:Grx4 family monothiol glutaredoxin [Sandaracinaceae bacterium]